MKIDPMQLYEERLLVLIEDVDEGVFRQVILSGDQFKKVSDAVLSEKRTGDDLKVGMEEVKITIGEKELPVNLFDGMSSIN